MNYGILLYFVRSPVFRSSSKVCSTNSFEILSNMKLLKSTRKKTKDAGKRYDCFGVFFFPEVEVVLLCVTFLGGQ